MKPTKKGREYVESPGYDAALCRIFRKATAEHKPLRFIQDCAHAYTAIAVCVGSPVDTSHEANRQQLTDFLKDNHAELAGIICRAMERHYGLALLTGEELPDESDTEPACLHAT